MLTKLTTCKKLDEFNDMLIDSKVPTSNSLKHKSPSLHEKKGVFRLPKLIALITFFFFSFQGATQTYIYTSSGSYTVPAGVHYISVECIGGGGGGGRIDGGASGGGGGGAYVKAFLAVTPGTTYSYVVGTGGSGSTGTKNGGDSWFGSSATVMAKGGNGTPINTTTGSSGGSAAASVGDVKYFGGNGGNGGSNSANGGGGGGAAGASGNGSNGVNLTGGNGVTPGGKGGNGRLRSSDYGDGVNGSSYGGGGGGAVSGGSWYHNIYNGGNGANGMVRITLIPAPVSSFSNYAADPTLSTSFAHRKGANSKPKFTVKSTLPFNEIQFELNTQSNFSGTAFVSTINDGTTYAGNTLYDFWTTTTLTGADQTYFARCRVSDDGGVTYGPWTTELWPYSYFPATPYPQEGWYYTTGEQFLTGVVQEATYNNTVVNTTPAPDNGNIILNQGAYSVNAGSGDGVLEGGFYPDVGYMTIGWQKNCTNKGAISNGFPFRFNIPRNSLIQTADFSVTGSGSCPCVYQDAPLYLIADAHNVDNAPTLNSTNVTSLTGRTTANQVVNYTSPNWANGSRYTLTSVSNILQEVVNRSGWNPGNNFNLLLRWNPAYTAASSSANRCMNQADNGATTAPRIQGTFTNYKNTIRFPSVKRDIYGPLGSAWDELIISDVTNCTSCYTEYQIHNAANNAVVAGPFLRTAGLNGSQSFDISTVVAQEIYVSATVYRSNTSPQINDIWLTTITPSPLPIKLTSFSTNCETDGKVTVKWETASEMNSSHYILQRSEDLISWMDISQVSAKGNSSVLSKYTVIDSEPNRGTNYYRLVQYDFNGEFERFNPISSVCNVENFSIVLYPNPSEGKFNLKVESDVTLEDVHAFLYDGSGKMIFTEKMNFVKGVTQYAFPDLSLSKGSYILKFNHPKKKINSIPFIVK